MQKFFNVIAALWLLSSFITFIIFMKMIIEMKKNHYSLSKKRYAENIIVIFANCVMGPKFIYETYIKKHKVRKVIYR